MSDQLRSITSKDEFHQYTSNNDNLHVIHFEADWLEQCTDLNEFLTSLVTDPEIAPGVKFYRCLAEKVAELSYQFEITAAPTVVIVRNGETLVKLVGANREIIFDNIKKFRKPFIKNIYLVNKPERAIEQIKQLLNDNRVILFMKGSRNEPRCGFSRQIIDILNSTNAHYETFDILQDEIIRQELKTYSDWPTYPQLYIDTKLIGGLDIVREMHEAGELTTLLKDKEVK